MIVKVEVPKEVRWVVATTQDVKHIISFLKQPVVDNSFIPPLSIRSESIEMRVVKKLQRGGFWLIALHDDEIIACRGCNGIVDEQNGIVEFSTLVVHPAYQGRGIGRTLMSAAIDIAIQRYSPKLLRLDSWDGNIPVEKIMTGLGFEKRPTYYDPKRPPGILSVEYQMKVRST